MTRCVRAPYGSWSSPITSDLIAAESIGLLDVLLDGTDVYWIEGRPREAGRYVLVRPEANGATKDIYSSPYNARTRVHEYGGGAVTVSNGTVFFSNFDDQRLYRLPVGKSPVALTPPAPHGDSDHGLRYADGQVDVTRKLWIGVREDHLDSTREAINCIVAIDTETPGAGRVLASGSDFYASPRMSPDGKRLAWLAWNHPNMPWTTSELWVGDFDGNAVSNARRVAGGTDTSIFQPEWSPDGKLFFVSDQSGWWNIYRLRDDGGADNLCPREAEFGQPQWNLGMSTYAFLSDRELVCTYTESGKGMLGRLDLQAGELSAWDLPYTEFSAVRACNGVVAFRAGAPTIPASIVVMDPHSGSTKVLRKSTTAADEPSVSRYLTIPQSVEFPTSSGKTAFGLFYPPSNPDYLAVDGELPPLVVKCHGGPTSAASSTLDLRIQFWTSRGIAVMDVDYGGSSGYGREYRNRLNGNWGVVDVEDCCAAADYLVANRLADGARSVITGGSAGGYTVLACLAFRECFRAGGSHYGVSDLAALAKDTHKFESHYLDLLIGPYPESKAIYDARSPVQHSANLTVPVAFFQGSEDKIVPPNQTEVMVDSLRKKGLAVQYLLFDGEQHGFRRADNIKRAIDAELYFYSALAFKAGLRFGGPAPEEEWNECDANSGDGVDQCPVPGKNRSDSV